MFKDKAYVCNHCRKVITFSSEEAGTSRPCPFCRTPLTLPSVQGRRPVAGAKKKSRLARGFVASVALACAAGASLLLLRGNAVEKTLQSIPFVNLGARRITVAPEPARARGVRATVSVTEVRYACADIYHPSLRQTSRTETPVCCIKLAICNTGKRPVAFRSWRTAHTAGEATAVRLTDGAGRDYSRVSFGAETYPLGMRQEAELASGDTLSEQLLFISGTKPNGDLELVLPCEHLGGKGDLRFRIPAAMIQ